MAYSYYRELTSDNTKVIGTSNFTNYVALVDVTNDDFKTTANGGLLENANGYDLAFFDDSGLSTQIDHHILLHDVTTGHVIAKVEIPILLYNSDDSIYIGYTDSGISASQEDIAGTYPTSFKAVYPFDPGYSGSDQLLDATSNNNDLTNSGTTEDTSGKIASSRDNADTVSQYLYAGDDPSLKITGSISIKCWFKFDNSSRSDIVYMVGKERSNLSTKNNTGNYGLRYDPSGIMYFFYFDTGGSNFWGKSLSLTNNTWYHVVVEYTFGTGSSIKLYIDGVDVTSGGSWAGSGSQGAVGTESNWLTIGAEAVESGIRNDDEGFQIDDIMIHSGILGNDWATTNYNNEDSPATFWTLGSRVEVSAGGNIDKFGDISWANISKAGDVAKASISKIGDVANMVISTLFGGQHARA